MEDVEYLKIRESYIESLSEEKRKITLAFQEKNFKKVAKIAHQLVSGGFFGFDDLSQECKILESTILENNLTKADQAYYNVCKILDNILSDGT